MVLDTRQSNSIVVLVSYLIHYDSLLQNLTDILLKNATFVAKYITR